MLTQQDVEYLNSIGVNPDDFDVDSSGSSYVPKSRNIATQPAVTGTEFPHPKLPTSDTFSPAGTAVRTFAHEAPSALAGGYGFAKGMAAGARLPIPHPIARGAAALGTGILGGLGVGGLTRFGQAQVEKPFIEDAVEMMANPTGAPGAGNPLVSIIGNWLLKLQRSQAENPKSAIAGNIATMPLAGMNPSPTRTLQAAKYGIPWLLGHRPPVEQIPNIANVGIGAALQPAIGAGQRLATGEPIEAKDLALETLIGAIFNNPNAIGRRFGFTSADAVSPHPTAAAQQMQTSVPPPIPTMPANVAEVMATGGVPLSKGLAIKGRLTPAGVERLARVQENPIKGLRRPDDTTEADVARMEAEGGMQYPAAPRTFNLGDRPIETIPPERALVLAEPGKFRQPPPQKAIGPERAGLRLSDESSMRPRTRFEQEVSEKVAASGISPKPTQQWKQMVDAWGLKTRNVTVKEDGSIVDENGKSIAGQAYIKPAVMDAADRVAKINPAKEAIDTRVHELFHFFIEDLRNSPKAYDKLLVKRYEALVNKSPELAEINAARVKEGRKPWDADEFITSEQGSQYLNRQLGLMGEKPMQTWWRDFSSHLKTRYGKEATEADYRRLLNYRFQNDPAFAHYFKTGVKAGLEGGRVVEAQSDESSFSKQDAARLQQIRNANNQRIARGESVSDIQERDAIYAKYKGRPDDLTLRRPEAIRIYANKVNEGFSDASTLDVMARNMANSEHPDLVRLVKNSRTVEEAMLKLGYTKQESKNNLVSYDPLIHEDIVSGMLPGDKAIIDSSGWDYKGNNIVRAKVRPATRQSDESSLVPLNHPDVTDTLNSTIAGLKEQTLTTDAAKEYKTTLLNQLDMPEKLREALDNVDAGSMTSWIQFRAALQKAIEGKDFVVPVKPKNVGAEIEKVMQPAKEVAAPTQKAPAKPVKAIEPGFNKPKIKPFEGEAYTRPIKTAEQTAAEKPARDAEWAEIDQTDDPYRLAEKLRTKYNTATTRDERLRYATQYNTLVGLRGLKNVEPIVRSSDESSLERPVTVRRKDGTEYEAFFADKYYDWPGRGKVASIAKMTESGQRTHGALLPDETIIEKGDVTRQSDESSLSGEEFQQKARKASEDTIIAAQDADPFFDSPEETQRISQRVNEAGAFLNPTRNADESSLYETKIGKLLLPIASEIDKIRVHSPEGKKAAAGLDDFYKRQSRLRGEVEQTLIRELNKVRRPHNLEEFWKQDNEDFQAVVRWLDIKQDGKEPGFNLTDKQKEIEKVVRANLIASYKMREERPELAHKTSNAPFYLPHTMSRSAATELANNPGSEKSMQYYRDFLKYQQEINGLKLEEAKNAWTIVRGAFTKESHNLAQQFGPIDKASGIGLPRSMREQNLMDRMARFNRRYARRLAYHDAVEQNKEVSDALFNKEKGLESMQSTKNVLEDIYGVREHIEANRNAALGIVRAAMLGPLTGAKDFVANLTLGLQHQDASQWVPGITQAVREFTENYDRAIKKGSVRYNISGLELGDGGITSVVGYMQRLRDVINTVQGRQALETATRIVAFGQGRYLAVDALAALRAKKLSFQKTKFLKDFVPEWEKYRDTVADESVINEAAANFVDSVQGTYDYRGQPSLTMRGTFAPILSLARWNVEKFNNFVKFNIEPARQGNWKPLLMSTLGMIIGGAAVTKLVEEATGRKERTPKLKEIAAAKDEEKIMLSAYKLAGLSSMAGYGGIMGDLVRSGLDYHYKNRPQIYNNPLVDGIAIAAENTGFLWDAMNAGDIPAVTTVINQIMEDYFQAYRLAIAHVSPEQKEELERRNKMRDVKQFKMGQGLPLSPYSSDKPNPFIDKDLKNFKKTSSFEEAAQLLPGLLQKAFEDSKGDPERLKAALLRIKINNYQTMPNPRSLPKQFYDYYMWLNETQGAEEAAARIQDYFQQNTLNKAKASLVPSL